MYDFSALYAIMPIFKTVILDDIMAKKITYNIIIEINAN